MGYFSQPINPFSGVGDAFANAWMQAPLLRQQQQMRMLELMLQQQQVANQAQNIRSEVAAREAQIPEYAARTKLYDAQTGHYNAAMAGEQQTSDLVKGLEAAMFRQGMYSGSPRPKTPFINSVPGPLPLVDALRTPPAQEPIGGPSLDEGLRQATAEAVAKSVALAAIKGHPEQGAEFARQNAANLSIAPMMESLAPLIATGTKVIGDVGPGATALNYATGQPMYKSPRALTEGSVLRANEPGQVGLAKAKPLGSPEDKWMPAAISLLGKPEAMLPPDVKESILINLKRLGLPRAATEGEVLSKEYAQKFLDAAGGDKDNARILAKAMGYTVPGETGSVDEEP